MHIALIRDMMKTHQHNFEVNPIYYEAIYPMISGKSHRAFSFNCQQAAAGFAG
jgi:hypothetical protein